MSVIKLNSPEKIKAFLKGVVSEAIDMAKVSDTLAEKEKQIKLEDDLSASSKKEPEKKVKKIDLSAKKDSEPTPPKENPQEKKPESQFQKTIISHDMPDPKDITVDMVVSRINLLRAGRSLNNEDVAVEMKHYFEALSNDERLALLSFLTGLSQILNSGEGGESAVEPEDNQVKITKQGGDNDKEIKKAPPVEKHVSTKSVAPRSRGMEDTSAPIRPVESSLRKNKQLL